jgi:hypothetical protein
MSSTAQDETAPGQHPKSRIPEFATIEEEAEFWDTHSSTDFEDEFEVVTDVRFVKTGPTRGLIVRLEREPFARLRQLARAQGVDVTTLVQRWIEERLGASHPSPDLPITPDR